jgi:hypothetical protein
MTDTPETDDLARGNHVVPTEFAQHLERERDEARNEIEGLHYALKRSSTIYDVVIQQRDKLAEVLRSIRAGWGGQITDPDCGCDDCKFLTKIDTALQSLTQNEL